MVPVINSAATSFRAGGLMVSRAKPRTLTFTTLPGSEAPDHGERLQTMFALRSELALARAVQPLELRRDGSQVSLVCADPGGSLLSELIGEGPIELVIALELAVAIAAAVARFHACGLVHRDLQPENIWVSLETGEAWLAGTGLALRAPRPGQPNEPPEVIVGTLPYMAPEQTGRMNRAIDCRADLYALGVILYELLTSRRPFVTDDSSELLHSHVTRDPEPLDSYRKGIPVVLARLVLKLLSKDPGHRYQTASGLEADLARCLASWRDSMTIPDFPLGSHDRPSRLAIPERLFGRDDAITTLHAAFDRVATTGAIELMLVAGYSGVGKSAVVEALKSSVVPSRGVFCSGKFDERRGDVPYATLVASLRDLVRRALCLPRADLDPLRASIVAALGENAGVVCALVPELASVIGPQAPCAELPARDSRLRLHRAIEAFLGVFAKPGRPLALFIDDLQWLDAATLDLVEHMMTKSEARHLLLLGAYRDNEVSHAHPLRAMVARIAKAGARVHEIVLRPLEQHDVAALLSTTLRAPAVALAPLTELIFAKTQGNPFFTIQLLSNLAEEGLLSEATAAGDYASCLDRIEARGISDDLSTLLCERITRLSRESRSMLDHLACLGVPTSAATLAVACAIEKEQIASALDEATAAGLLAMTGDTFHFAHDRISETAYQLIPAHDRQELHLNVGRRLYDAGGATESDESIFAIVGQYNSATSALPNGERTRVASLNLSAARRARAAAAYLSALTYADAGAALLSDHDWQANHALAFALTLLQGECNLLTGDLVLAENQLREASKRANNSVELAAATCLQVDLYTLLDRSDLGVGVALRYLASVGIDWTPHPDRAYLDGEYGRFHDAITIRGIESLAALPLMTDLAVHATMDVLTKLQVPAMFSDENLAGMVLARMANLSLAHGNSPGSCFAYGWLAGYAGAHLGDVLSARKLAKVAVELVERPELGRYRARVYCLVGYLVTPWIDHLGVGRPALYKANGLARAAGDVTFVTYTANHLITIGLGQGQHLEALERQAEEGRVLAREAQFGLVTDFFTGQLRLIRSLLGREPAFSSAGSDETEGELEARLRDDPLRAIAACWYWIRKLQAQYHACDYRAAEASSKHAHSLLWTSTSDFEIAEFHLYAALNQAALASLEPAGARGPRLAAIRQHHEPLRTWARGCPANFEFREALIRAELAALEGDREAAAHGYEQAVQGTQRSGFAHYEGLAFELASRFHASCGDHAQASSCRSMAVDGYKRWGATALVTRLASDRASSDRPPILSSVGTTVDRLDLATMIAVSQSVSAEIELDRLIRTIITAAAQHAGAQRVALVLAAGDELTVVAEASTDHGGPRLVFEPKPAADARLPEAVLRYSARTGETVNLADAAQRRLFSDAFASDADGQRSMLCLPLLARGAVVGLLHLEHRSVPDAFTPKRLQLLGVIASQAANALENARLYAELKSENAERRRAEALLAGEKDVLRRIAEGESLSAVMQALCDLARRCEPAGSFEVRLGEEPLETEVVAASGPHVGRRETFQLAPITSLAGASLGTLAMHLPGGDRFSTAKYVPWVGQLVQLAAVAIQHARKQDELSKSEERFRQFADALPEVIWITDLDPERVIYCSPSFERIWGRSVSELYEQPRLWTDSIHPQDRERVDHQFSRWISGQADRYEDVEFRILRPDGTIRWIREIGVANRGRNGVPYRVGGIAADVTERRETEEQLRRNEAHLSEAQRIARMCSFDWMLADGEIYWSDETRRVLGYDQNIPSPLDALLGRVHSEEQDALRELFEHAVRGREIDAEHRLLMPNGSAKHVHLVGSPTLDENGSVIALRGTIRDITERKLQDEAKQRAQAELAHLNRLATMGELTASIAHEINQPLSAIVASAAACGRWLGAAPPNLENARETLTRIARDGKRAGEVIKRLRAMFQKADLVREAFDVSELIRDVHDFVRDDLLRRRVALHIATPRGLPSAWANRVQIQQVLLNLVVNAVESMEGYKSPNPTLTISAAPSDPGFIEVSVVDSGCGLSDDAAHRVFEAFYSTKQGGMGMGLSISRSIVEAHGGVISAVNNDCSAGATFRFTLPVPP